MRTLILMFLILTATLCVSQTKHPALKVDLEVYPPFEKLTLKFKAEPGALNNCKVQILDSKKNIVKTVDLPKAADQLENSIAIADLAVGNYTCHIYNGKEELYTGDFFKDAMFAEPHTQPVLRN